MSHLKDYFSKDFTYAIVGATKNTDKFGYKIVKVLKEKGFNVIPINPHEEEICGIKAYPNLYEVPDKIDVVDFVVPCGVTFKVLDEVNTLKISKVWFQPRSQDGKCITYCKRHKIKFMEKNCLFEEASKL